MAKEEMLEFEGVVAEVLPDARCRVKLDNGHEVIAYTSGRMKKNRIRILAGDRVTNANGINSRVNLGPRESDGRLQAMVHQFAAVRLIIHNVREEVDDVAQVGGFGSRAFYPTQDRVFVTQSLFVQSACIHPVQHSFGLQRVGCK